jgi:hypothetical protein
MKEKSAFKVHSCLVSRRVDCAKSAFRWEAGQYSATPKYEVNGRAWSCELAHLDTRKAAARRLTCAIVPREIAPAIAPSFAPCDRSMIANEHLYDSHNILVRIPLAQRKEFRNAHLATRRKYVVARRIRHTL